MRGSAADREAVRAAAVAALPGCRLKVGVGVAGPGARAAAVSWLPTCGLPQIDGATVFTGADKAIVTGPIAVESAEAVPALLLAVTVTAIVDCRVSR